MRDRLTVGPRPLKPFILVRIQVSQHKKKEAILLLLFSYITEATGFEPEEGFGKRSFPPFLRGCQRRLEGGAPKGAEAP